MSDLKRSLDEEAAFIEPSEGALHQTIERASARSRRQRATALTVGLAVTLSLVVATATFRPMGRPATDATAGGSRVAIPGGFIAAAHFKNTIAVLTCVSSCGKTEYDAALTLVDSQTGEIVGGGPVGTAVNVAISPEAAWVIAYPGDLHRFDLANGDPLGTTQLSLESPPDGLDAEFIPSGIAAADGAVWV